MVRYPAVYRLMVDLPLQKKLILMVAPLCLIVIGLLMLGSFGMEILSGSRAYVGGEGLWSKSQKAAVLSLGHYAYSHDESEYQAYLANLRIPLGDREARLELEKPRVRFNFGAATAGFERGGNHPKDIAAMIHLFRWFRHVSFMNQAIDIWGRGDDNIADLKDVGEQIHREMTSGHASATRLQALLKEVQQIDARLTPLENSFSATLGEGARWMKRILITAQVLLVGLGLAGTLTIAFLMSRHLCHEIEQLRTGASRIANGDFNFALDVGSKDEIGDMARSFQQMASQRGEVEKLKEQLYSNVLAANKELEAFSYSVSHDLRAPLRAIDGFSKELEENCREILNAQSKEDLRRIRAATQRMNQLIEDLLELSRLSRRELQWLDLDLSAVAHDIAQNVQKTSPGRKVEWVIAPELTVQGDPHLLRIALENLFGNAWKFTQQTPRPRIELGGSQKNDLRHLFIRDNGVGFDMNYVEKLFKPFQRLHDMKEFPGTGIGLALVQRIVNRHGGEIRAEAESGRGATFYFTLPVGIRNRGGELI